MQKAKQLEYTFAQSDYFGGELTADITYLVGYISHRSRKPFALAPLVMPDTDITFVHSGHLEYSINGGKKFNVNAGQAVVFPLGCTRERFQSDEHTVYTSIVLKNRTPFWKNLPTVINNTNNHDIKYCLDKLIELYSTPMSHTYEMCDAIVKYLLLILTSLAEDTSVSMQYTMEMKKYIADHYGEKITLKDISNHVHISQPYASSIFRKESGVSINEYLIGVRISAAESLLKYTEKGLSEIAHDTGFGELFYFSRVFKKKNGISPSEYRKAYLKGENKLVVLEYKKPKSNS